ncbi:MAG TPA: ClpXP protease specificity-enhancing factor [Pasteurellaceae bacterium]|nr:ClpXP protease specificity-enhancing factor [Pasteurellaceae bacterium]
MATEYKSSPKRPYILRAYFDWLVDNAFTPYLVVDATYQGAKVPLEYVKDGQIVLNLSASAVGNLTISNESIQFSARFRGIPQEIYIPMGAALAIYARENGDGVLFDPEKIYDQPEQLPDRDQPRDASQATDKPKTDVKSDKPAAKNPSHLKIIK